jgi:chromosome segregation ATPase
VDDATVDVTAAKEAAANAEITLKGYQATAAKLETQAGEVAAQAKSAMELAGQATTDAGESTKALKEMQQTLSGFTHVEGEGDNAKEHKGTAAFAKMSERVRAIPKTVRAIVEVMLSREVEVETADGETERKKLKPEELFDYVLSQVAKLNDGVKGARNAAAEAVRKSKKAETAADKFDESMAALQGKITELEGKKGELAALVQRAEAAATAVKGVETRVSAKISEVETTLTERLTKFEEKVDGTFGVVLNTFEANNIEVVVPEEGESNE